MLVDSLRGALLEHYVDSSLLWCDHTASIGSISAGPAALRQRAPAPALLSRWYGPNRIKIPSLPPSLLLPPLSPPSPPLPVSFHTDCFAAVNGSRGERERERESERDRHKHRVYVCVYVCVNYAEPASERARAREREQEKTKSQEKDRGDWIFFEGNTKVDKSSLRGSRFRTGDCCASKDGPS